MDANDRFRGTDIAIIVLVFATALGLRYAYVKEVGAAPGGPPVRVQGSSPRLAGLPAGTEMNGKADPTELDAVVHNLKEHHWFGSLAPFAGVEEPTSHIAPGYPWLLALLHRVPLGEGPVENAVRWIQCLLGSLTAVFYFLFCRRAFGSRLVGLLAGLMAAAYPFWILNTAEINDGVVATFLLALAVWLGVRGGQEGGAFTSLLFGATLAALALVRAALLPFAFVALLGFLYRCRTVRVGWLAAVLSMLGFFGCVAPWTLRNWQVHGDLMPIVNSTHLHLWVGNNPKANGGPQTDEEMRAALASQADGHADDGVATLAAMKQGERFNYLGREAVAAIRANPAAACERRLWAGLDFFFGEDWFTRHQLARREQSQPLTPLADGLVAALPGSLFLLFLLSAIGWRWTYGWRAWAMPSSLAVFWIPLFYILSHAEGLSGPRLPLDGVLICYAAFALVCLTVPGLSGPLRKGPAEPSTSND